MVDLAERWQDTVPAPPFKYPPKHESKYTKHPICIHLLIIEGSLEVKLPTIWTHEKQRWEESERREA